MIFQYIGDALIYLVGLPIFAFQTFEGIQALVDTFNSFAEQIYMK